MRNSFVIFDAIREGNTEILETALRDGWNPNILIPTIGFTPLTLACACNQVSITKSLLQSGACVHIANKYGKTAMVYACEVASEDLLLLLMQYGGSPIESNLNGDIKLFQVLDTARFTRQDSNSEILSSRNEDNDAAKCTQILLDHGIDPNAQNSTFSVLIHAVARAQPKCINLLLENGADPNLTGCDKMTPLMYAALFRSADETNLRRIINSLLIHGAEVGMKSNTQRTAFEYALSSKSDVALKLIWPHLSTERKEQYLLTNISIGNGIELEEEFNIGTPNQRQRILKKVHKCTIL